MKATRKSERFEPITIILETEEEAELIWRMLTERSADIERFIGDDYKIPDGIDTPMFHALDKVFTPESEKDC